VDGGVISQRIGGGQEPRLIFVTGDHDLDGNGYEWRRAWQRGGTDALMGEGRTGPKGYLDPGRRHRLRRLLRRGAKDHGFTTDAWTLNRVRRVIAETFGTAYTDPSGVWRLLKAMGWSVQVPARRAVERGEEAIAAWIEQIWPQIEKKGGRGRGLDPFPG
jgi:transposase